jgi:predicted metal-dependent hydrolase
MDFELIRCKRKSVLLRVNADATLTVRAPWWMPKFSVVQFVTSKANWVAQKQAEFITHSAPTKTYAGGETFYCAGEPFTLERTAIKKTYFDSGVLHIPTTSTHPQKLLDHWYRVQATELFEARLLLWYKHMKPVLGVREFKQLSIRKMATRWGSCRTNGNVTLNLKLMAYPKECLDYVIVHELSHLKEMNHSPRFYALMAEFMPEWKQHKTRLQDKKFEW